MLRKDLAPTGSLNRSRNGETDVSTSGTFTRTFESSESGIGGDGAWEASFTQNYTTCCSCFGDWGSAKLSMLGVL